MKRFAQKHKVSLGSGIENTILTMRVLAIKPRVTSAKRKWNKRRKKNKYKQKPLVVCERISSRCSFSIACFKHSFDIHAISYETNLWSARWKLIIYDVHKLTYKPPLFLHSLSFFSPLCIHLHTLYYLCTWFMFPNRITYVRHI